MLLEGRKSRESCTEPEQILVVRRILAQLLQLASAAPDVPLQQQLGSLWRRKELDLTQRRNYVRLSKKYLVGMASAAAAYEVDNYDSLIPRYLQGEFDSAVHATADPRKSAKYWPWVKEVQASAVEEKHKREQAELSKQAAAAQQEADNLMHEAEGEKKGYAALDDTIAAKMEVAYHKTLAAHFLALSKAAGSAGSLAEELWVKHQDAEQSKRQQAQDNAVCPWQLVEMRREGNMLSDKQLSTWMAIPPPGKPWLLWMDTGVGDFSAQDLHTALTRAGFGGAVVVLVTDPAGPAGLVQKEHALLSKVDMGKVAVFRMFTQWRPEPHQPQQQGWLLMMANLPTRGTLEEGSALLARMCKSVAVTHGALLSLPPLDAKTKKVDTHSHAMLPEQRGHEFYLRVLPEIGVMTQLMICGLEPPDFTFVQPDAEVGECLDVLATAHRKLKTPKQDVFWIGGITSGGACKRSAANCYAVARQVVQEHHEAVLQAIDTTVTMDPRYFQCAEQVPATPEPPKLLMDRVTKGLLQPLLPEAVQLRIPLDLNTVQVLDNPVEQTFRQDCPANLALALECSEQGVVVGRSFLGQRPVGLYPAKSFQEGDVICWGLSLRGVWIDVEEMQVSTENIRWVCLELVSCFRKPKVMCCVGDTRRHAWANMNSCLGTGLAANVVAECIPGPMHDSFLVFRAAAPIPAMEGELLWDFPWRRKDDPAPFAAAAAPAGAPAPAAAAAPAPATAPAPAALPAPAASPALAASASAGASGAEASGSEAPAPSPAHSRTPAFLQADLSGADDGGKDDDDAPLVAADGGGEGDAQASGGEAEVVLTMENIAQHATRLQDVEEIAATTYWCQKTLHFFFDEPCKLVAKHSIVWDIDGGSILKEATLQKFPYAPNAKTIIYCAGEFGALHEFCGKAVQSVWGRTFTTTNKGCGFNIGAQMSQGKPISLFWTPPQDVPVDVVVALQAMEEIEAIFKFAFSQDEEGMMLSPCGLILRTANKITQKSKTKLLSVPRGQAQQNPPQEQPKSDSQK